MTQPAILLCNDEEEFIRIADEWSPGMPFPLIDCPALSRYQRLFPGGELPPVTVTNRVGRVISIGGDLSRAVGSMLAVATSRSHCHLPESQLMDTLATGQNELAAVVGLASEFSAIGDWPGKGSTRIGLLVGRSAPSLICLLYRCLTVAAAPSEDRTFIASNPLLPYADEADATDLGTFSYVRDNRVGLLVVRGSGRECSTSLLDSVLCGRAEPLPTPMQVEYGLRATPCLHGDGCFRTDLLRSDIFRAVDVNASLVFLHSCSTIAVGAHAYPHSVGLALSVLEGTAVAVIGVAGTYFLQRAAEWDLRDGLKERLPLGEVVHRMITCSRPLAGDLSQFGMLGDPGIVLSLNRTDRARPKTRLPRPRGEDVETLNRLACLGRDIVPRLERLRWLDLDIPDDEILRVRDAIRLICRTSHDTDCATQVTALEQEVTRLQLDIVRRKIHLVSESGWSFVASAAPGFREISNVGARCSICGEDRTTRAVMKHLIEPELYIQTLQCPRCNSVVWWTTEPGLRTAELTGPVDITMRRGQVGFIKRQVQNNGDYTLRGALGCSFRHRNRGFPPGGWTQTCEIEPGQKQLFLVPVNLTEHTPQRDAYTVPFIALLNGIYTAEAAIVQVE
jgi:hypothetical protein